MGQTFSKTQLPSPGLAAQGGAPAFLRGLEKGREVAGTAARRIAAWTEEHPGQALLAGLAAGFILGKLLFPRRRHLIEELEAD